MTNCDKRSIVKEQDAWSTVLLFDPIAIPLVRFSHKYARFLSPDHLTFFSLMAYVVAMLCLYNEYVLHAVFLIFTSVVFDCMDGKLARLSKSRSKHGKYVDAGVDLLVHSFGFLAIAYWHFQHQAYASALLILMWSLYFGMMHINAIVKMGEQPSELSLHTPREIPESKWALMCKKHRLISNPLSDVDIAFVVIPASVILESYSDVALVLSTFIAVILRILLSARRKNLRV